MGKRKCYLVIDTETAGDISAPLVYDIGATVVTAGGQILERGSWVVYDIYAKEREKMQTAYYAEKLPNYEAGLKTGEWEMKRFYTIRKIILDWMEKYQILAVCAYNANFDRRALNNTQKYLTNGKYRFFFPFNTEFIDIWNMACSTICQSYHFLADAYENDWYSEKGNVRTSAEIVFRYLTKVHNFEEAHTALNDAEIETQIFLYCRKKATKEESGIAGNPWLKPQKNWNYVEAKKDKII